MALPLPPSLWRPPALPLFFSLLFLPSLPPFLPPSLLPSLPSSPFLATKSAVLSTISDTESQEDNWSRVTADTSLQMTAISMTTHNTLQPQYKYMYMYRHTVCMYMYMYLHCMSVSCTCTHVLLYMSYVIKTTEQYVPNVTASFLLHLFKV